METIVTIYVSEPIESVREIPAVCKCSLSAARKLRFFAGPGSTLSGEASEEVCQKLMQRALPTTSYAGFDTLVPEESQVRAQLIKYASAVGELTMDWSVFLHGTMPEMLASCMRQSGEQRRLSHGVRIAQEYIRAHSECDLNVTDIAQMAGYTPNHMSSLFKKEMGVSIFLHEVHSYCFLAFMFISLSS